MKLRCKIHKVPLVCYCPACRGEQTSKRKAAASRENGRKGGRPRKPDSEVSAATLYRRKLRRKKQLKERSGE